MAAQTVHFMNGEDKSLALSLLNRLFKGQSKFSILPFATTKQSTGTYEGGIQWAGLSFEGADEIFTVKDTFSMTKADDTREKLQIQQNGGATVDEYITERGDWTFEGNIPVIAAEYCSVFYDKGATITHSSSATGVVGQTGVEYEGQAYFMEPKDVEVTMAIENDNVDLGLAFARVKMTVSPVIEGSSVVYLKLRGTVLVNPEKSGTQGEWTILNKYVAA